LYAIIYVPIIPVQKPNTNSNIVVPVFLFSKPKASMTHQNVRLASAIAAAGFIFTSRPWLRWLNTLSPEVGLLVKNVVIFLIVYGLHVFVGVVGKPHVQALGVLLVYIGFTLVFNYQSRWIEEAGTPEVEKQTPDGATYERARTTLGMSPDAARLFTFVFVPFVLVLVGSHLKRGVIRMD
jgi:hypothetical protein